MSSILQKNFGWPSSDTHRCFNIDCDQIIDCHPTNSALCKDCHSRYHKTEFTTCHKYTFINFSNDDKYPHLSVYKLIDNMKESIFFFWDILKFLCIVNVVKKIV